MKKVLFLLVMGVSLCSCANAAKLNMTLSSVDVSRNNASNMYILEQESNSLVWLFEDDIISTKWQFGDSELILTLGNLTDNTLKIIWDDAAFIDVDGTAGRIMHTGTKYSGRSDFQPPTIIPKKTTVNESILPTRNVLLGDYVWVKGQLFIYHIKYLKDLIKNHTGKHIKLLIPIVLGEEKIEYLFDFRVKYVSKIKTKNIYYLSRW